jgi:enoyl-CoA hydratase/carnithine racemase
MIRYLNSIEFTLQNNIGLLRVNRPQARNALDWAAQEGFAAAVTTVAQTPACRALIITGTGRQAFVAGGDLKELSQHPEPEAGQRLNRVMSQALHRLTRLPIPTIAAVNGDAFGGGCEILTACDLRLARQGVRFCFAQAKNGLTTGWGGTGRLVALLGLSPALELLLTGRLFDADEARRLGLIHRLVATEADVVAAAHTWANELLDLPQAALAALKQLAYQVPHLTPDQLRGLEGELFTGLWHSPDHREALAAFKDKRRPNFNQGDT